MVIIILKRSGVDELEPVARWDDGEWIDGDQPFTQTDRYERYTPELLIEEFNGPDLFAMPADDWEGDDE